jgi:hypothetical protein
MSRYYNKQTQYDWEEAFIVREEKHRPFPPIVVPPPRPIDPRQVQIQEIRRVINKLNETIRVLYDLSVIDERGHKWPVIHKCYDDCRSHPRCMMKNYENALKILAYHRKVQKEQEERHERKEFFVKHLCCSMRMGTQHIKRQDRTITIVGKKFDRVQELLTRLEPFVTEHTDAILTHCKKLRTFELVKSNQEAMSKIDLLEERIRQFIADETWYKSGLDDVFRDIDLHLLQF